MKPITKLFTLFSLVILIAFVSVPSVLAFDCRGGIQGDGLAGCETVILSGMVTTDLSVPDHCVAIHGSESIVQMGVITPVLGTAQPASTFLGSSGQLFMMNVSSHGVLSKVHITHGLSPPGGWAAL